MKELSGEKIMALAAAVSAELSHGKDADEIIAVSDFFEALSANLALIGGRRAYRADEKNKPTTN